MMDGLLDFNDAMANFQIMFPSLSYAVIEKALRRHKGAVENTVDTLLNHIQSEYPDKHFNSHSGYTVRQFEAPIPATNTAVDTSIESISDNELMRKVHQLTAKTLGSDTKKSHRLDWLDSDLSGDENLPFQDNLVNESFSSCSKSSALCPDPPVKETFQKIPTGQQKSMEMLLIEDLPPPSYSDSLCAYDVPKGNRPIFSFASASQPTIGALNTSKLDTSSFHTQPFTTIGFSTSVSSKAKSKRSTVRVISSAGGSSNSYWEPPLLLPLPDNFLCLDPQSLGPLSGKRCSKSHRHGCHSKSGVVNDPHSKSSVKRTVSAKHSTQRRQRAFEVPSNTKECKCCHTSAMHDQIGISGNAHSRNCFPTRSSDRPQRSKSVRVGGHISERHPVSDLNTSFIQQKIEENRHQRRDRNLERLASFRKSSSLVQEIDEKETSQLLEDEYFALILQNEEFIDEVMRDRQLMCELGYFRNSPSSASSGLPIGRNINLDCVTSLHHSSPEAERMAVSSRGSEYSYSSSPIFQDLPGSLERRKPSHRWPKDPLPPIPGEERIVAAEPSGEDVSPNDISLPVACDDVFRVPNRAEVAQTLRRANKKNDSKSIRKRLDEIAQTVLSRMPVMPTKRKLFKQPETASTLHLIENEEVEDFPTTPPGK